MKIGIRGAQQRHKWETILRLTDLAAAAAGGSIATNESGGGGSELGGGVSPPRGRAVFSGGSPGRRRRQRARRQGQRSEGRRGFLRIEDGGLPDFSLYGVEGWRWSRIQSM